MDWITIIVSILSSTVVSAVFTHLMTNARENRKTKREKIETVHQKVVSFNKLLLSRSSLQIRYCDKNYREKVEPKAPGTFLPEEENKIYEEAKTLNSSIEMICGMYFPRLHKHVNQVNDAQKHLNHVSNEGEHGRIDRFKTRELLNKGQLQLLMRCQALEQAVVEEARRINNPTVGFFRYTVLRLIPKRDKKVLGYTKTGDKIEG